MRPKLLLAWRLGESVVALISRIFRLKAGQTFTSLRGTSRLLAGVVWPFNLPNHQAAVCTSIELSHLSYARSLAGSG